MTIQEERDLLSTDELAAYLSVHPDTLMRWRQLNKGPAFIRIGKKIWYERSVVVAWLAAQS